MTAEPPLRSYALVGKAARAALDWLHVRVDVRGVVEEEERIVVWLASPLPSLPFADLRTTELAIDRGPPPTGLENDVPILLAENLLVRPPWVPCPSDFVGIDLVVPRGGAFGSGEHESSQAALLCLHAMWDDPDGLCDVGTGSGLLARYAMLRGTRTIEACDIDAPSVAAARELLPGARVVLGGPEQLHPCAAVVANMTGAELAANLPAILSLWTGRGPLVLAGMRVEERAGLVSRLPLPVTHEVVRAPFCAVGCEGS